MIRSALLNFSQEQTCPGLSNELNQAATYPSPYANVHKGNMNTMGGSTGVGKDDTWKPSTMEMRTSNTEKVNNFIASLPPNLSEKNKNSRKLQFMTENGIRQLGLPRIGHFADKLRPEPMHCEINTWQHYIEAVKRGKFDHFVFALAAPIGNRDGDAEEGRPQKTLLRVSGIKSVGERARKQEILQKSEEDLKQYLQKTGFPHVRHASGKGGGLCLIIA